MPVSEEQSTQYYQLHSPLNFETSPFPREALDSPEALANTLAVEVIRAVKVPRTDWTRLRTLPWGVPLDEWAERGVPLLQIRRGESRHPVVFVERKGRRYALKETSPRAATHEAEVLRKLRAQGIPALQPVGVVIVRSEPVEAGVVASHAVYESGDVGYLITRLAERVLPQSLLYRYPFTVANKRILWNAVVGLLVRLHDAGVYWGDPSLANILIEFDQRRIRAVLADAETAEVNPRAVGRGGLSEGMRRQDIAALAESLIWQAEDIRLARGLPEDAAIVTDDDVDYIESRYVGLRAEHAHFAHASSMPGTGALGAIVGKLTGTSSPTAASGAMLGGTSTTARGATEAVADSLVMRLHAVEGRIQRLAALGYDLLNVRWLPAHPTSAPTVKRARKGGQGAEARLAAAPPGADEAEITAGILRPTWYVQRLRELLGEEVPRAYAWRLYYHLNIHKWLLSERAGHDVGIEAAAHDWREHIHDPLQAFLRSYLPDVADSAQRYAAEASILDRGWQLSQAEAKRPVPVEEAALDYALGDARAALAEPAPDEPTHHSGPVSPMPSGHE